MATAPTKDTPDLSALLGIKVQLGDATEANASEMKTRRGRQEGEDVQVLRSILQDAAKNGVAKVFTNVADKATKDTLTRKVRQAGKGAGTNGSDIEVATSYNASAKKLFWGPKTVIDSIKASTSK